MCLIKQSPTPPALVIDGSGASTFVGVLGEDRRWLAAEQSGSAPLESLFPTAEMVLEAAGLGLDSIQSFVYSEGPGSVLGLRFCAMAIETWSQLTPNRPKLFAFNSLQLAAVNLIRARPETRDALVISDWKKTAWNAVKIEGGEIGPSEPVSTEDLQEWEGQVYHLPARKGWQEAPNGARRIDSTAEALPDLLDGPEILKPTKEVELYSSGVNTFQKWTPERHRAG